MRRSWQAKDSVSESHVLQKGITATEGSTAENSHTAGLRADGERLSKSGGVPAYNSQERSPKTGSNPKLDTNQSAGHSTIGQKRPDHTDQVPGHIGSNKYEGKRDLELVSKFCQEAGFEPTGKPLKRFPADYFEKSRLLAEFDKYLSDKADKGCNLNREETSFVLGQLRKKREGVSFLGGIISGVPGCGKTTLLRKVQTTCGFNSCVVLGNERTKIQFTNLPDCHTVKELLLLPIEIRHDVLLIDEYTLLTNGEILLLQRILGARVVLLFGDKAQGSSVFLSSPEWAKFPIIYYSRTSRRFGKSTASLCSKQGFDFCGGEHEDEVKKQDYEGSSERTEINLVFTKETKEDLSECGIDSTLVVDVQGKEYDSVTLFLREEDKPIVADAHLRAVAFTRHKRLLIVRVEAPLFLQLINGELTSDFRPQTNRYA